MHVDAHDFVAVMAPALFRSAALASSGRRPAVIRKPPEQVPGSDTEVDRASRVDVLSGLDLRIQEMLLSITFEHWPFVAVLVEEETATKAKFPPTSTHHVLIDPVDGTRNYLNGDPHYCHIVALMRGPEMIATLLYSHAAGRLYVAIRGSGARVLSPTHEATAVRIPSSFPATFFHHVSRVPDAALDDLRSAGLTPAVSTQNASDILGLLGGEASGFISCKPLVYDVWAPGMIVQEAGGWLSDWCGSPLVFEGRGRLPHVLIATSSEVAAAAVERLARYG